MARQATTARRGDGAEAPAAAGTRGARRAAGKAVASPASMRPGSAPALAPDASGTGDEGARARTYRGQNANERSEERRQRLIDAASELYGTAGYHATSVKAVCQKAGLTERYFYESFANSEELLCACADQAMQATRRAVRAAVGKPRTRAEALRNAGMSYIAELRDKPAMARLTLFELEGVSADVERYMYAQWHQTAAMIERLLRVEEPDPATLVPQPSLVAIGLMGALYQLAKEWVRSGYQVPVPDVVEALVTIGQGIRLPDGRG